MARVSKNNVPNQRGKIRARWQEVEKEYKRKNVLPLVIIGLVIGGALIAAAIMLFSPHQTDEFDSQAFFDRNTQDRHIKTTPQQPNQLPQTQVKQPTGIVMMPTETVGSIQQGEQAKPETIRVLTPLTTTAQSGTIAVVDTVKTRQLMEAKLQEEMSNIHNLYMDRRRALLNEAVAYLRGNHTQRAVQAKAQNFSNLASELEKKINEFPKPTSEFEAKLHEYQKQELRKTIDFLNRIARAMIPVAGDQTREKRTAAMMEAWSVE